MNNKKDDFLKFLDEQKIQVQDEIAQLEKEYRKDESNILKAKANIYDIVKAFWPVSESVAGDNAELFQKTYLQKVENLAATWKQSLDTAKQHGDDRKVAIEMSKLTAIDDIVAKAKEVL